MKPLRCVMTFSTVAIFSSTACGATDQYLLYKPSPVTNTKAVGEGVLVKSITIKKGDTLTALSRRYGGKGSYFPQILLFNPISDPDLIYAGKELRVPVKSVASAKKSGKAKEIVRQEKKVKPEATQVKPEAKQVKPEARREGVPQTRRAPQPALERPREEKGAEVVKPQAAPPVAKVPAPPVTAPPVLEQLSDEQAAYQKARKAYLDGNYQVAANLFGAFLERYPNSRLAPDATLYRGDAYLRLSER